MNLTEPIRITRTQLPSSSFLFLHHLILLLLFLPPIEILDRTSEQLFNTLPRLSWRLENQRYFIFCGELHRSLEVNLPLRFQVGLVPHQVDDCCPIVVGPVSEIVKPILHHVEWLFRGDVVCEEHYDCLTVINLLEGSVFFLASRVPNLSFYAHVV